MDDFSDHFTPEVSEKFDENRSNMDDFTDPIKSEDTSETLDLPPPDEGTDSSDSDSSDEVVIPTKPEKKPAEVLVEIDQDRKKVITINDGDYDSLVESFLEAVAEEPGLTECADSTFVFQVYNQKFNTWVDIDRSKDIIDGSHLKVIFVTETKLDTGSVHKCSKTSKRRLADSSDYAGDDFKSQSCSSDDNVSAKRICGTLTDAEKNSVTSDSIHGHDLTDNSPASDVVRRLGEGLSYKNPISALHELCTKLHWEKPVFEMHEQGTAIEYPKFLMKVTVGGQTYIPDKFERKKQLAKTTAALYCLKKLGVFE